MSDSVVMRGVNGQVFWGYQLAATVKGWTAVRGSPSDPGTVTATIVEADTFRVSQRPLTFVVTHKHGVWRWPIQTLQIADGTLVASLSPPELPCDVASSSLK